MSGSAGTGKGSSPGGGAVGEVYFEFVPVGNYMRVNAIHAATGREIFVLGPLTAPRAALEQLALRKLARVLQETG